MFAHRLGVIITQELMHEADRQLHGFLHRRLFWAAMGVDIDRFCRSTDYLPASLNGTARLIYHAAE